MKHSSVQGRVNVSLHPNTAPHKIFTSTFMSLLSLNYREITSQMVTFLGR